MSDVNTGWRKRQVALDIKAENARELGLDYEPAPIAHIVGEIDHTGKVWKPAQPEQEPVCRNCIGSGWEPTVNAGRRPCGFCQPAQSQYGSPDLQNMAVAAAIEKDRAAQPAQQEPVAWPCVIAEADFEQNTVTLEMQCSDYKVGAGQHWLHTTPPAAQRTWVVLTLTDREKLRDQFEGWSYPAILVDAVSDILMEKNT